MSWVMLFMDIPVFKQVLFKYFVVTISCINSVPVLHHVMSAHA